MEYVLRRHATVGVALLALTPAVAPLLHATPAPADETPVTPAGPQE